MNLSKVAKTLVADLLQLDNPTVVAGVVGVIVSDLNLFGVNAGPHGAQIAAILAAAGAAVSAITKATSKTVSTVGAFHVVRKGNHVAPAPAVPVTPVTPVAPVISSDNPAATPPAA